MENDIDTYTPLANKIIFRFIEDIGDGTFTNKTSWGLQIRNKVEDVKTPRWAEIVRLGPTVPERFSMGDYILIEQLMWTDGFLVDEVKYWVTNTEKVMARSKIKPEGLF